MRVEESIIIDRPAEEVFGFRATVVYEPERLPGGVLGRLTAPLTARIVRRSFRADLARLKDLLEAEARAAR